MFCRCEEFQKQATKEDTEKDDEEKREKTQERNSDSDECTCDFDVDCPACTAVLEDEKCLQDDYQWTAEDEAEEREEYRALERKTRREKRQEMLNKANIPLPALPERELSQYEKIREDIIAERKIEWAKLEAKWDAEWDGRQCSYCNCYNL